MPATRTEFRRASIFTALVASAASASMPSPPQRMTPAAAATHATPATTTEQHALTLARELVFGSTGMYLGLNALFVPWDSSITPPTSEATMKSNGLCTFRSQFYVRNIGFLTSIPTQNTVRRGSVEGPLLSSMAMGAIPYLTVFNNSTDILLAPGTHMLYAKIDAPNTNAEYYESNNLNRVQVVVSGSCS